jgi:hypothetical protein
MPISITCEKRHDRGLEDVYYPVVTCDRCGRRVDDHRDAQVYWLPSPGYGELAPPMYLHADCCRRLEAEVGLTQFMPLGDFTRFLSHHLDSNNREVT